MKRSQINRLIDEAIEFFDSHQLKLPPWAYWTTEKWQEKLSPETLEIRSHGMGWNLTSFGSNDFFSSGLLLCILRNGLLKDNLPQTTKTYAEKAMMVRPGQITPWHYHLVKTEDLINRGGGRLEIELGWVMGDGKTLSKDDVIVQVDGITKHLAAGSKLILEPGESVTLEPKLCHQFCGHKGDDKVCVGEVSSLNDDNTDNYFLASFTQPSIIEDEARKYWLINDYPR